MAKATKKTTHLYQIMVYAPSCEFPELIDEDGYTEWGIPYKSRQAAIEAFERNLRRLYKTDRKLYNTYKGQPVKIVHTVTVSETRTESELLNI